MRDLQAIADRVEIEALRGEFTDAALMRDYDRFASLFTQDGAWRIPYANVDLVGREAIRAGIERAQDLVWDYFVQTTHPGTIELERDAAVGRAYIQEFGQMRDGSSRLHCRAWFPHNDTESKERTEMNASLTHTPQDSRQLAGTRWRLDPSASSAEFRVPNLWGLASVEGRFQRLDGRLEVDGDQHWQMELTLDADSLDTGNRRRDRHLRSAAFFDVEHHTRVRFRSSKVSDHGDGRLRVEGELEAAGERDRLQVDVTVRHADGGLELEAAATVDQRQLGMTWSPLGVVGTPTALSVRERLRRER